MTTEESTEPTTETTAKKPSMRSVLMDALRKGETDTAKLVAIGKAHDPNWDEKRIKASIIVHKGYLKKQTEKKS